MTPKETTALTAKELALYLGCRIIVSHRNQPDHETTLGPAFLGDTSGVKPILRRLESMTEEERKEIEETKAFQRATPVHQVGLMVWTAESFKLLLSKSFDLFGWIDKGLAIDQNTLKP